MDAAASIPPSLQILAISSDDSLTLQVKTQLQTLNASVHECCNAEFGLKQAIEQSWHLVYIDTHGSSIYGIDLCRQIRAQRPYLPIIMLVEESRQTDGVIGLESGADDYLAKPLNLLELTARTKALLRRQLLQNLPAATIAKIQFKEFTLDKNTRELTVAGNTIPLTAREFELVWLFANHPNKVFSRSELLDKVWGYQHDGYEHTVNSHINRLRSKVKATCSSDGFLETVWGVGYRLRVA